MGWLGHQLIDIIEWTNDPGDTLLWHFPRYENEIKYGAKLIVREGQSAAFVNEGKLADVFGPGTYTLATQNLPVLATLKGWKYGFESPYKADVYFVSTRTITDRKWGTKNPIMMRDPEFGPVRLRAFGTFAPRVSDPAAMLRSAAGASSQFTVEDIESQLRDLIVSRFADSLGAMKIGAMDLAGNYDKIGRYVAAQIQPDFAGFGMQIVNLLVENISLPPEVEAAIDKRSSMGVIGNMQAYTQYQTANAIPEAAANPGGLAGSVAGMGMGFAVANQISQGMNQMAAPPPVPQTTAYFLAVDGKQAGPFDMDALKQKVAGGQLTRGTLVWKNGMPSWQKAAAVGELAGLFSDAPPAAAAGRECMIYTIFTILLTVQFIVMALHDLVEIPGWTHGKQVQAALGRGKLWVGTAVNAVFPGLACGFAWYFWNRPKPPGVTNYWMIYCGITLASAITMWYVPYFFGATAKVKKMYAEMYEGTRQILPPRGDNPRPNLLHICFHVLFATTMVLSLILRFVGA